MKFQDIITTKVIYRKNKQSWNITNYIDKRYYPNLAEVVYTQWYDGKQYFRVSHIIANQWLVSGEYENEDGFKKLY